ncbi:MAG: hypothetical protein RL632_1240 [Bacteroidota bacterium]
MKTVFFLGAIALSFTGVAQGVVQFPVFNVLYLGFSNRLEISVPKDAGRYTVFAEGATLQKHEAYYTVLVKEVKRATIGVLNEKGDTIGKQEFICKRLPTCELYWGSAQNGESLLDYWEPLQAGYPDVVHLTTSFSVVSYELTFSESDQTIEVQGNEITSSVVDYLNTLESKTQVFVKAKVLGPDGIQRIKTAVFVYHPI